MKKDLRISVRANRNMVNDLNMLSSLLNKSDGETIEIALNTLIIQELRKKITDNQKSSLLLD